jgi:hypothetical protein
VVGGKELAGGEVTRRSGRKQDRDPAGGRVHVCVSRLRRQAGTAAASRPFGDKQKATTEGESAREVDGSGTCKNDRLYSMAGSQVTTGLHGDASKQWPSETRRGCRHKVKARPWRCTGGSKTTTTSIRRGRRAHLL